MRDIAERRNEVNVDADNVDKDWDFEGVVSVNEVAVSGVCDKLKEVQRIYGYGGDTMSTSVVKVIGQSQEIVDTKRTSTKLAGRVSNLSRESQDVRSVKR